ncbi:hypothetical protein Tco_0154057 [Tanacetum coccineum]
MVKMDLKIFSRGLIGDNDRCDIKREGFEVVEERLVHLRMEVKFEVLIEKKKMYYLGLRRFDLWMEFWMAAIRDLDMKKRVGREGFEEEAFVEFMKSARPRWDSGQLHRKSGGHSEEIRDF